MEPSDVGGVAEVQNASPEAAHWTVEEYLTYDTWVAICENRLAGFICTRQVAPAEGEILNLAVAPEFRRRGIARVLVEKLIAAAPGSFFLEVRASNKAALNLYKRLCFQEVARRPNYYDNPAETAIVMKFHSC